MLPHVQVDKGAIRFILSGANIMCPGLTSRGARMDTPIEQNQVVVSLLPALWCICDTCTHTHTTTCTHPLSLSFFSHCHHGGRQDHFSEEVALTRMSGCDGRRQGSCPMHRNYQDVYCRNVSDILVLVTIFWLCWVLMSFLLLIQSICQQGHWCGKHSLSVWWPMGNERSPEITLTIIVPLLWLFCSIHCTCKLCRALSHFGTHQVCNMQDSLLLLWASLWQSTCEGWLLL